MLLFKSSFSFVVFFLLLLCFFDADRAKVSKGKDQIRPASGAGGHQSEHQSCTVGCGEFRVVVLWVQREIVQHRETVSTCVAAPTRHSQNQQEEPVTFEQKTINMEMKRASFPNIFGCGSAPLSVCVLHVNDVMTSMRTLQPLFRLHYKGCPFHRIVKGFVAQTGDIATGTGAGGESIWGKKFKDDLKGLKVKLDKRGCVAMCNNGKNTNTSQFFFALAELPKLTGKHVVFGEIVEGMEVVDLIEEAGTEGSEGKPQVPVIIADCGVME